MRPDYVLNLHQSAEGGPLLLVELHGDVPDGLLEAWDQHMFQGVYPAARLFNFLQPFTI